MKLVWAKALELGVPALDEQHRRLFALKNALEDCAQSPEANHSERFHELLSGLFDYAMLHFEAEEAYMRSIGYPRLAEHISEHRQFVERVADFNLAAADDRGSAQEVLHFLADWLICHVQFSDLAIRDWATRR